MQDNEFQELSETAFSCPATSVLTLFRLQTMGMIVGDSKADAASF
jgi:hypothetical protein